MATVPPGIVESLPQWLEVAVGLARRAGEVVLDYQDRLAEVVTEFKGRRELVTEADRASERVVVEGLRSEFPDHAILAEEGVASPRGAADRESDFRWLVDPLDGTTNFVHAIPFHCVALSLDYRGELLLGVVHAPALGDTYTAILGQGAWRNEQRLSVTGTSDLRDALVATGLSYQRNEPGFEDNTARFGRIVPLCRDLRRLGSAQLDLCLTASGTYDGYWEMYLQPYDVAAGGLIVREAGGKVTDLSGGDDWVDQGQVLATNGALHDAMMAVVGGPPGAG